MLVKLLVAVGCTVFLAGCFETDPVVKSLQDKNAQLESQVSELNGKNARLKEDVETSRTAADLANNEAERWRTKYTEGSKLTPPGGGGISPDVLSKMRDMAGSHWEYKGGVLRAQSDILFESGKADLKPQAQAAIDEVAPKLKSLLADKSVMLRVDGFTDNAPIKRSGWKSNLHLSLMRAMAVVEALEKRGVPADSVCASGWGDSRPIPGVPQDKNRRVELVIVPANQ